jgi:hypothetical protein
MRAIGRQTVSETERSEAEPAGENAAARERAALASLADRDAEEALAPKLGQDPLELRAEGVALHAHRPSWRAATMRALPIAYAGVVLLRDGTLPPWIELALVVGVLAAARVLGRSIDELPEPPRRAARVTLIATLAAALLALVDLGAERGASAAVWPLVASIGGAAATRAAQGIPGMGGLGREARPRPLPLTLALTLGWPLFGLGATLATLSERGVLVAGPLSPGRLSLPVSMAALALIGLSLVQTLDALRTSHAELGARERHQVRALGASLVALAALLLAVADVRVGSAREALSALAAMFALCLAAGTLAALVVSDPIAAGARMLRTWAVAIATAIAWMLLGLWHRPLPISLPLGIGALLGGSSEVLAEMFGLGEADGPRVRRALRRARAALAAVDSLDLARGILGAVRLLVGRADPVVSEVAGPLRTTSPLLLTFTPPREVRLGAAGEPSIAPLASRDGAPALPSTLLSLLTSEPLGVVRADVLAALEVRRPDLRPALHWCRDHHAAAVVALVFDGDLEGALVVHEGLYSRSIGLRSARVYRQLCRELAARVSLDDALARAATRAEDARRVADEAKAAEHRATAAVEAARAAVGAVRVPQASLAKLAFAPETRMLSTAIDRLAHDRGALTVVHRPGTDPLPWIAELHSRAGRPGALHVLDAATELPAWSLAAACARDGTLVVLHAQLLDDAARRSATALAETQVVLAIAQTNGGPREWSAGSTTLTIPPLSARAGDLRALCLWFLARQAATVEAALGLSDDALAALVEHDWPGDEAELWGVLSHAVALRSAEPMEGVVGATRRIERRHVLGALGRGANAALGDPSSTSRAGARA